MEDLILEIYNEDKTKKLTIEECDLTKGYLIHGSIQKIIPEKQEIAEQGHYETIREYPNGGKDVVWKVDVPRRLYEKEKIEDIPIQIYIPYSPEEILQREKQTLRETLETFLSQSDYKVLKFIEGYISIEDFQYIKEQRQYWRNLLNIVIEAENIATIEKIKKEIQN